jgi:hypothetical protein
MFVSWGVRIFPGQILVASLVTLFLIVSKLIHGALSLLLVSENDGFGKFGNSQLGEGILRFVPEVLATLALLRVV